MSRFNRTKDKGIDWAGWSWNPVTGCEHDCPYCYARDIANRFYPEKFKPTFHAERFLKPLPNPRSTDVQMRSVFVCSMGELFGEWVPQSWIDAVMQAVRETSNWNYLFLTKNPKRLPSINWPANAWVGASVDYQWRVAPTMEALAKGRANVRWVSCEPMMEPLDFAADELRLLEWLVIGGRSKSSGMPRFQPGRAWVRNLIQQASAVGCPVFCKANLGTLIGLPQQLPHQTIGLQRVVQGQLPAWGAQAAGY